MFKNILLSVIAFICMALIVFSFSNNNTLIVEKKSMKEVENLKKEISELEIKAKEMKEKTLLIKEESKKVEEVFVNIKNGLAVATEDYVKINKDYNDKKNELNVVKSNLLEKENAFRKLSAEVTQINVKKEEVMLELKNAKESLASLQREVDGLTQKANPIITSEEINLKNIKDSRKVILEPKEVKIKTIQEIR